MRLLQSFLHLGDRVYDAEPYSGKVDEEGVESSSSDVEEPDKAGEMIDIRR